MAKQRTNNGPLKESADKHSIYTPILILRWRVLGKGCRGGGVKMLPVVSLQRVMGAKTRLFFRRFRGVSHVTGTLPTIQKVTISN
jgi:hypothetical protein